MTLREEDLRQFTGGDQQYATIHKNVIVSEGVHHVREAGEAWWLIDKIAVLVSIALRNPDARLQDFQVWTLKVNENRSAVLTCVADSDEPPVVEDKLEFTDFPLDTITFYALPHEWLSERYGEVTGMKLILPSEY